MNTTIHLSSPELGTLILGGDYEPNPYVLHREHYRDPDQDDADVPHHQPIEEGCRPTFSAASRPPLFERIRTGMKALLWRDDGVGVQDVIPVLLTGISVRPGCYRLDFQSTGPFFLQPKAERREFSPRDSAARPGA